MKTSDYVCRIAISVSLILGAVCVVSPSVFGSSVSEVLGRAVIGGLAGGGATWLARRAIYRKRGSNGPVI